MTEATKRLCAIQSHYSTFETVSQATHIEDDDDPMILQYEWGHTQQFAVTIVLHNFYLDYVSEIVQPKPVKELRKTLSSTYL